MVMYFGIVHTIDQYVETEVVYWTKTMINLLICKKTLLKRTSLQNT